MFQRLYVDLVDIAGNQRTVSTYKFVLEEKSLVVFKPVFTGKVGPQEAGFHKAESAFPAPTPGQVFTFLQLGIRKNLLKRAELLRLEGNDIVDDCFELVHVARPENVQQGWISDICRTRANKSAGKKLPVYGSGPGPANMFIKTVSERASSLYCRISFVLLTSITT